MGRPLIKNTKMKRVILIAICFLIGLTFAFHIGKTNSSYDPVRFYNKSGAVNKVMRIFVDSFAVSNANGGSLDISAAGFNTVVSISATAYKNTATATSVANVGIKSYTTTAVVLNMTEGNGSLINVLGNNVLLGASTAFASTTNLFVHITVIGY